MKQGFAPLRLARLLAGLCLLQLLALVSVAAMVHAGPRRNALLVPRSNGIFVVGENRFGLLRIHKFQRMKEVEAFLTQNGLAIPDNSYAHIRPVGRTGHQLSAFRLSWSDRNTKTGEQTPVVEAHSAEVADFLKVWIENGALNPSRLGYAIPLVESPEASYGL